MTKKIILKVIGVKNYVLELFQRIMTIGENEYGVYVIFLKESCGIIRVDIKEVNKLLELKHCSLL